MFKTLILALIFTPTSALAFDPSILVEAQILVAKWAVG